MKEPLYILDGYGLIYRAYFAFLKNPLFNSNGDNTSAVFGFFRTFFALQRQRNFKNFVVALDSVEKTFRHEMYDLYKAHRDKTPDDLHAQIPVIEEILSTLGVPSLRVNGFEADDIIATLVSLCLAQERECVIISGDKDLLQLLRKGVTVLYPKKGEYLEIDESLVPGEWGVRVDQIVDYLSLTGDQADNIPGVKGIGPKTAISLLSKYDSLEGIYSHLDEITGSQKKKLEEDKTNAFLSRKLIVLRKDVPLNMDPETFRIRTVNASAAKAMFLQNGMKSLVKDYLDGGDESERKQERGVYRAILDKEDLDRLIVLVKEKKVFSFDVETDSVEAVLAHPVGFSIAVASGEGVYIPIKAKGTKCLAEDVVKEALRSVLTDKNLELVGQNIKYDYKVLVRWGIEITNIAFDTMIAAWLLDSDQSSFGMDAMAERFLDGYRTIHFNEVVEKGETFDTVPLARAAEYAAEDADITFRLYEKFKDKLIERKLMDLFKKVELPLIRILAGMELAGIRISKEALEAYGEELGKSISSNEKEIYSLCGEEFNVNSTKQLQEILFVKRKLKPVKKTKTGFSTDTSVLEELSREDPVAELVLKHRIMAKLKSTYVDTLPRLVNPETGRIHTHFVQTGTATGRLSSRDPNLQNIPIKLEEGRRIRQAFIPGDGNLFLSADYSQIELVVLAHLSGDEQLIKAFSSGDDVHRQTGAIIFGVSEGDVSPEQRRIAKIINFGVMYGMSGYRLSRELRVPRGQADAFISSYFEKYKGITTFIEETGKNAENTGVVKTYLGRERIIRGIGSRNKTEKMAAQRMAVNTPIQGTAADIVKLAMINLSRRIEKDGLRARLILQVHDELIFEVPGEEAPLFATVVKEEMESAVSLSVPLRVSIETGTNWGDLH